MPAAYSSCVAGAISEEEYLAGLRAAGLVDVEVRDRLVYDAEPARGLSPPRSRASAAAARRLTRARLREYVRRLEGKIWSAKIYARKPA